MTLRACFLVAGSLFFLACHSSSPPGNHGGAGGVGGSGGVGAGGSGGSGNPMPKSLSITPNPASVTVQVTNGVGAPQVVGFSAADENGNPVTASWQIDRGELGSLDAGSGKFTASGKNAGKATVTATVGSVAATAALTVIVQAVTTGATPTSGTGPQSGTQPSGGFNGVGGEPLGPAPPAGVVTVLQNGTGADAGFKLLYPYDGTVFPCGMLPPLLQWSLPTNFKPVAVMVHLKENGYEFTGYYAGPTITGKPFQDAPVDAAAWTAATHANGGDPLLVEVKISDGTQVLGPLSQHWTIAPSPLRGTVYYNTYDSKLNSGAPTNGSDGIGSVLKIQPGAFSPDLAIPALNGTCHACHEVSSDGSTLFTANSIDDSVNSGVVYDLRKSPAALLETYSQKNTPGTGGLFTYGGIYPDGGMALASSKEDFHAWGGNSDVYSVATQAAVGTTGFTNLVTQAVTPAYSPDGGHVAFSFWGGVGNATVKPGSGVLALMDSSCGAVPPVLTCSPVGPFAFANLRQLYAAPSGHYVGWPSFTPDSKMVVYQHTFTKSNDGGSVLNTRAGAQAELWLADVPDAATGQTRFAPRRLCAVNGYSSTDCTTPLLPTNSSNHGDDEQLNFEPNVTPIASGGYYWVVFTSRRLYGNQAVTDPYYPTQNSGAVPTTPPAKKLWMAAIDPNPKANTDPSHPAFYLPGQEIMSGNMRAFWVNEPCHPSGATCQTGDECCTGFCSDNPQGQLVCGDKPVGCVPEFGKCASDADCCGGGSLTCINQVCSVTPIS